MKQRYRLKLTVTGATGNLAWILKIFPNALTFVKNLSADELKKAKDSLAVAQVGLAIFGVEATLEESK